MGVMEIMSFLAIPVNIAIILFTKNNRTYDKNGKEFSVPSAWRASMIDENKNSFWTESNVILFAVLMEHFMMIAKVMLNLLIVDVPVKVETDEKKRQIDSKAAHRYLDLKASKADEAGETFESMVRAERHKDAEHTKAVKANM